MNQELLQDADRISQELKSKNIAFAASKKGNGYSVEVAGSRLRPGAMKCAPTLESTFDRKYTVRSTARGREDEFQPDSCMGSYIRDARESTVRQALETIRRRVDALGVTEPTLQIYGGSGQEVQDQIIVELPGIDDPDRVKSLIENTAQLELRLVKKDKARPFSSIESRCAGQRRKICRTNMRSCPTGKTAANRASWNTWSSAKSPSLPGRT